MKKILFLVFLLVAALVSVQAQFVSEADVLAYLDGKTFKKESVGATLFFHEAASILTVNGSSLFSRPDVSILTSEMALVVYWGVTDSYVFGQFGSSDEAMVRMNNLGLKGFITKVDASVLKQK